MIELIIDKSKDLKKIAAVENGKLVEIYEENEENKNARNEGNIYLGIVKDIVEPVSSVSIILQFAGSVISITIQAELAPSITNRDI